MIPKSALHESKLLNEYMSILPAVCVTTGSLPPGQYTVAPAPVALFVNVSIPTEKAVDP